MNPCRMAGGCPHQAVAVARIAGVGDRALCQEHIDALTALGMDFRLLEGTVPKPEWRRRDLARDMTRGHAA